MFPVLSNEQFSFCTLPALAYLEEIQSVRRHTNSMLDASKNPKPPVIIHCSAGVGRTGVVILTELMISCLEHNEVINITVRSGQVRSGEHLSSHKTHNTRTTYNTKKQSQQSLSHVLVQLSHVVLLFYP